MHSNANRKYSIFHLRASNGYFNLPNAYHMLPNDFYSLSNAYYVYCNRYLRSCNEYFMSCNAHFTFTNDVTSSRRSVIANAVKQSHIRTDCFVVPPRNDDKLNVIANDRRECGNLTIKTDCFVLAMTGVTTNYVAYVPMWLNNY